MGVAKSLQPLLPSSHGSELFNAASHILEEKSPNYKLRSIWISDLLQSYTLLLTSVLIFSGVSCTLVCDLEKNQEKQGFDFQLI